MALVLASVLALCEGVSLLPLHLLHQNDQLMNLDLHNDINIQHPNHKFFRTMVDRNHELTGVETYRVESGHMASGPDDDGSTKGRITTNVFYSTPVMIVDDPPAIISTVPTPGVGRISEGVESSFDSSAPEAFGINTPRAGHHRSITPTSDYKKAFHAFFQPKSLQQKPHKRQKRFFMEKDLRSFVVPLSIFNYLGFLPVRVPGLPYHRELPSPDYSYYDTTYEIKTPYRRKRRLLFF